MFSHSLSGAVQGFPVPGDASEKEDATINPVDGIDLYLAYRSNSGTCKDFVQKVGNEAASKGFISHIVILDSIKPAVPINVFVIIFTASYKDKLTDMLQKCKILEIELSNAMYYKLGDYISILPRNPEENVSRALSQFNRMPDQNIQIKLKTITTLPTNKLISVWEVFSGYLEIGQIASCKNIQELITLPPEDIKLKLETLLDNFKKDIINKHLSILNILELYPQINISLASFLSLLPAMCIHQYSFSGLPLCIKDIIQLPPKVIPGNQVQARIYSSAAMFHLPEDPSTLIIMFTAGSQIMHMHGFIQQCAEQAKSGHNISKMVLFFGCQESDREFLYAEDDLKEWQELNILEVRPAFSRKSEASLDVNMFKSEYLK
ncbi:hypothetical protein M422DRAFT_243826 [Sphaerobolus stellatus SS14]|nr:hypothetical protein M422DRAFT_243826 [Sphaerobolus stellatus SS14]